MWLFSCAKVEWDHETIAVGWRVVAGLRGIKSFDGGSG
jgi:hypothetical protein